MTCDQCHELLAAAVFDDGTPQDRSAAKSHLDSCAACRERFEEWKRLNSTVTPLPAIPESFWIRQRAAILDRLTSQSVPFYRLPRVTVAVAAALFVSLGLWQHQKSVQQEQMLLVQDADMLQHIDMLKDLDILEQWAEVDEA